MKLQTVRGTRDIYGKEAQLFREIESSFIKNAQIYDFHEIQTPVFEFTQVFKRTLGDQSDIVNKEMYTFEDRSGDSLTLRPEGTASVARAVISNSMLRDLPLKLYYSGPMFRHERPQKGRYRQFTQFGIELIGVDKALADIEVLACAWNFFKSCDLEEKVQLEINTIGDQASRQAYTKALIDYLSKHKEQLSEDSQTRLSTNPLRILDSKAPNDQEIVKNAPEFKNFLNDESKSFFAEVIAGLESLKIPFQLNPLLVRGLDYYNHTVFEFTTTHLGSQNAVLSGGRYNNLIEQMGGPSTPGVGWAAGTDRLALLLENPKQTNQSIAIISTDLEDQTELLKVISELRSLELPCQPIFSGNISKQLKKAHKRNCSHALIIGQKEVESQLFSLKDLTEGTQTESSMDQVKEILKKFYHA